ncbi:MAG: ribonuclease HII [Anaerolineae bacterium]|nr:ribonuclease HII [Anaerolineae bacterium]
MKTRRKAPTSEDESLMWSRGFVHVAGLDEAGRGPWAGPVYAAAVILPCSMKQRSCLAQVRDSKTLSHRRRVTLDEIIRDTALAVGVGRADAGEIDNIGIVPATKLAMRRALADLPLTPEALIIDALALSGTQLPQVYFPYADSRSMAVAAASIVAKVARDLWMINVADVKYPGYGFAQHKGYGTRQHRDALDKLGVCDLHRKSFRPVAVRLALPTSICALSENCKRC